MSWKFYTVDPVFQPCRLSSRFLKSRALSDPFARSGPSERRKDPVAGTFAANRMFMIHIRNGAGSWTQSALHEKRWRRG